VIVKGAGRTNGEQLGAYLGDYLKAEKNDRVEVLELKRAGSRGLDESIRGWEAEAKGSRCTNPLWHAQLRTPYGENLTRQQQREAVDVVERHLGFVNQPRAVVIHEKDGHEHIHVVWSRIRREDETIEITRRIGKRDKSSPDDNRATKTYSKLMRAGTAKEVSFTKMKNAAAAREIEERFNLIRVDDPKFANLDKAKARQQRREEASQRKATQKGNTHKKNDERELRMATITALWQETDSGKALRTALQEAGYVLAHGDRRSFVVVDQKGDVHELSRQVRLKEVKVAQVRERMADIDSASIPNVETVKLQIWRAQREREDEQNIRDGQPTNGQATKPVTASIKAANDDQDEARSLDPGHILAALTRNNSTFGKSELHYEIRKRLGDLHDPKEVGHIAKAVAQLDDFIPLGASPIGQHRYTSREIATTELGMRDSADYLASLKRHGVFHKIRDAAPSVSILGDEQRMAFEHVTSEAAISAVTGYAGSGKSKMLEAANQAWVAGGYRVRGVAISGMAADSLQQGSHIDSQTLASLFYAMDHLGEHQARLHEMDEKLAGFYAPNFQAAKHKSQMKAQRDMLASRIDAVKFTDRDVIVLDEAAMVGSRDMARLLSAAREAKAKVVLVGDAEQLQAIDAGGAFRAITDRIGMVKITDIRRQNEEWAKQATRDFGDGFTGEGLEAYRQRGHIHALADKTDARGRIIADWNASRREHLNEKHLMLAFTRADVADLNMQARVAYEHEGRLGISEDVHTDEGHKSFARGDRFLFLQNDKRLGVKNGTLGTVEKIERFTMQNHHRMTVKLDTGGTAEFSTEDYKKFAHGYASTMHRSQGVTAQRSFVLASQFMDRHAAYVAMTRHTDQADLYYSEAEFSDYKRMAKVLSRDRRKDTTLDYLGRAEAEGRPQTFWDRINKVTTNVVELFTEEDARQRAFDRLRAALKQAEEPKKDDPLKKLKELLGDYPDRRKNPERKRGSDFSM
jgi:hypothetical protein